MTVKLLTGHHLQFLALKGVYTCQNTMLFEIMSQLRFSQVAANILEQFHGSVDAHSSATAFLYLKAQCFILCAH